MAGRADAFPQGWLLLRAPGPPSTPGEIPMCVQILFARGPSTSRYWEYADTRRRAWATVEAAKGRSPMRQLSGGRPVPTRDRRTKSAEGLRAGAFIWRDPESSWVVADHEQQRQRAEAPMDRTAPECWRKLDLIGEALRSGVHLCPLPPGL